MSEHKYLLKKFIRVAPFTIALIAVGLLFKSCDDGGTDSTKKSSNPNAITDSDTTDSDADVTGEADVEDPTAADQTDGAVDPVVYTLDVKLEGYTETNIDTFRFYIDAKDGSKQTFLKDVATADVDFTAPSFKFASSELGSIKNFVDAETCLTLKAVRGGLESDVSTPFCFTDWH